MKMVYISTARIPSEKANTFQVLQMCSAFAISGIDVTLLFPKRENTHSMRQVIDLEAYYGFQANFQMQQLATIDLIWKTGQFFKRTPKISQLIQNRALRLLTGSYKSSISRYLKDNSTDVIYTRNPEILEKIEYWQNRITNSIHVCYEAHDFPNFPREQKRLLMHLKHANGVITITNHLKDLFIKIGIPEECILVAPDGVDLRRFTSNKLTKAECRKQLGLPQKAIIIGYVGRLETLGKEKGVSYLIEALALAKKACPTIQIRLCCVGGPQEMVEQYQIIATQLGLVKDEVVFFEQVPPAIIPMYIASFDICAMPFPWSQHYAYYMSPLKLFEYMAAKRPILATDLPSVKEVLHHRINGYLVHPNNSQALGDGIVWLITHPGEADAMAEKAFNDVHQYTWEKRAERILEFINHPK